jgi:hypothetical protein
MIIDAWYELSVVLADPIVPLNDVLHEWRRLDDESFEESAPETPREGAPFRAVVPVTC